MLSTALPVLFLASFGTPFHSVPPTVSIYESSERHRIPNTFQVGEVVSITIHVECSWADRTFSKWNPIPKMCEGPRGLKSIQFKDPGLVEPLTMPTPVKDVAVAVFHVTFVAKKIGKTKLIVDAIAGTRTIRLERDIVIQKAPAARKGHERAWTRRVSREKQALKKSQERRKRKDEELGIGQPVDLSKCKPDKNNEALACPGFHLVRVKPAPLKDETFERAALRKHRNGKEATQQHKVETSKGTVEVESVPLRVLFILGAGRIYAFRSPTDSARAWVCGARKKSVWTWYENSTKTASPFGPDFGGRAGSDSCQSRACVPIVEPKW